MDSRYLFGSLGQSMKALWIARAMPYSAQMRIPSSVGRQAWMIVQSGERTIELGLVNLGLIYGKSA